MQGGLHQREDNTQEYIPVQLDENSPIEFITKAEAIKITVEETTRQLNYYKSLSDDEKEEFLANLAFKHIRKEPDILSREVVECTINRGIYNFLRMFYIPETVAKTTAHWISWFIRGLGSISYNFIKTTILYIYTHWQRMLLLFFADFVIMWEINHAYLDAVHLQTDLAKGDISAANILIRAAVTLIGYTGGTAVKLLELTSILVWYPLIFFEGKLVVNYILDLKNTIPKISADCVIVERHTDVSSLTKAQIEEQVNKAFKNIKTSRALKKGIADTRDFKNIPAAQLEKEFVAHVENAIANTPVSDITNLVPDSSPEKLSSEKYHEALIQYSVKLVNTPSLSLALPEAEKVKYIPQLQGLHELPVIDVHQNVPNKYSIRLANTLGLNNNINEDLDIEQHKNIDIVQNLSKKLDNQFSVILA